MNYRDIAERAIWTFFQAFLAVVVVGNELDVEAGLVAGLAAAVSVVKNAFRSTIHTD